MLLPTHWLEFSLKFFQKMPGSQAATGETAILPCAVTSTVRRFPTLGEEQYSYSRRYANDTRIVSEGLSAKC